MIRLLVLYPSAIYLILVLCIRAAVADGEQLTVTCPAIQTCIPRDGPKKNKAYAKVDQQAYDCYRYVGETELANQAAKATTSCLAIYGSTNATIMESAQLH